MCIIAIHIVVVVINLLDCSIECAVHRLKCTKAIDNVIVILIPSCIEQIMAFISRFCSFSVKTQDGGEATLWSTNSPCLGPLG